MTTRILRALVAGALLASLAAATCSRAAEKPANGIEEVPGTTINPGGVQEGAHPRVTLAPGAETRLGLSVAPAASAKSDGERVAYGRVLSVVPLSEQLATRETARAALAQTRSECDRVRTLHRLDQNTSKRELEAAELALRRSEIDLSAAQERLRAGWGDALAGREDLAALVRRLSERSAALGRIEVPAGELAAGAPTLAGLALATTSASIAAATLLGPAATTDPLTQGQGFLVLIDQAPPAPGSALVARLRFEDQVRSGVRVDLSSIVWINGAPHVWVESGGGTYERRPVTLEEEKAGTAWLVTGIEPGERVVVSAAQELLSEELLSGHDSE